MCKTAHWQRIWMAFGLALVLLAASCSPLKPQPEETEETATQNWKPLEHPTEVSRSIGEEPLRAETLIVAADVQGTSWMSPLSFFDPNARSPLVLVYQPLVVWDEEKGSYEPRLALSCESGVERLEVRLRPDSFWQDGMALTVEDALYSFERAKASSGRAAEAFAGVEAERVADDWLAFRYSDGQRPEPLLDALSRLLIVPQHIFQPLEATTDGSPEKRSSLYDPRLIGIGPYALDTLDDFVVRFVNRDDDRLPRYLSLPRYGGDEIRLEALLAGDADILYGEEVNQAPVTAWATSERLVGLQLNAGRAPLSDLSVRQALIQSIRRYLVAGALFEGDASLSSQDYFAGSEYLDAKRLDEEAVRYDPAAADSRMAGAGYERGEDGHYVWPEREGEKLRLIYEYDPQLDEAMRVLERELSRQGFALEVQPLLPVALAAARLAGDYDLLLDLAPADPSPGGIRSRVQDLIGPEPLEDRDLLFRLQALEEELFVRPVAERGELETSLSLEVQALAVYLPLGSEIYEYLNLNETWWRLDVSSDYAGDLLTASGVWILERLQPQEP